jgi:hypothetical protein
MSVRKFLLFIVISAAAFLGGTGMRYLVYHYRPAACHRSEATAFQRGKFSIVRVRSDCDGGATAVAWLETRYGSDKPVKFFEYEEAPEDGNLVPEIVWTAPDAFTVRLAKVWVVRRMDNRAAGWRVDYAIGRIEHPGGQ